MARPYRKKKEQPLLSDQEIYRLIKQHPEVKACKGASMDLIRAVFRAYTQANIVKNVKKIKNLKKEKILE